MGDTSYLARGEERSGMIDEKIPPSRGRRRGIPRASPSGGYKGSQSRALLRSGRRRNDERLSSIRLATGEEGETWVNYISLIYEEGVAEVYHAISVNGTRN